MKASTKLALRIGKAIDSSDVALVESLEDQIAVLRNKLEESKNEKARITLTYGPCHHGNHRDNCMRCEDESIY